MRRARVITRHIAPEQASDPVSVVLAQLWELWTGEDGVEVLLKDAALSILRCDGQDDDDMLINQAVHKLDEVMRLLTRGKRLGTQLLPPLTRKHHQQEQHHHHHQEQHNQEQHEDGLRIKAYAAMVPLLSLWY